MKSYRYFLACFLLTAPLSAEMPHQPGTFFSTGELKKIIDQIGPSEDLIVLKDGTRLKGEIPQLPAIKFKFGALSLGINDVAAIAVVNDAGRQKMQVITREGFSFVSNIPEQRMMLIQYFPSAAKATHSTNQEIEPLAVNYVLFRNRRGSLSPKPYYLYILEFKDGDQVPVAIKDETIEVSNGWQDYELKTREILNVSFDGGIYGILKDSEGTVKEVDYAFVKEKFLRVQVAKSMKTIGIPWGSILNIRLEPQQLPQTEEPKAPFAVASAVEEKKQPKRVFQGDSLKADPIEIAWVEEPKAIFRRGSISAETIDIAWVEEPKAIFSKDTITEDLTEVAWVSEENTTDVAEVKPPVKTEHREVAFADLQDVRRPKVQGVKSELEAHLAEVDVKRKQLYDDFEKLRNIAKTLDEENRGLQHKVQSLNDSRKELATMQDSLVSNLELEFTRTHILRESLNDLVGRWKKVRLYSKNLEQQLEEMRDKAKWFEQQIVSLQDEVRQKSQEIEEVHASKQELHTSLVDRINQLTLEKEYQGVYQEELEEMINKLLASIEDEKDHSRLLETELYGMTKKAATLENQYGELQVNVKTKWQEIERLNNSQQQLHQSLLEQINGLTSEKNMTLKQKEELEREVNELASLLEMEKEHSKELQAHFDDVNSNTGQFEERSAELEDWLQRTQREKTELASLNEELSGELAAAKREAAKLTSVLDEKKREIEEIQSSYTKIYEELLSQVGGLQQEVEGQKGIKSDLQKAKEKLAAKEQELNHTLKYQEKILGELDLHKQAQESKERESSQAILEMRANLENVKRELEEEKRRTLALKEKLEKAQGDFDAKKGLEKELERNAKKLEELESELNKGKNALIEKDRELEILKSQHEKVQSEYSGSAQKLKLIIKDKEDEAQELKGKISTLMKLQDTAQSSTASLQEELNRSNRMMEMLQRELDRSQEALVAKQNEVDALTISQYGMHSESSRENDLLKVQLQDELGKVDSLNSRLASILPKYETERDRSFQLEKKLQIINAQLGEAKSALNHAEQQGRMTNDRLSAVVRENQNLHKERDSLVLQLQRDREELKQQRERVGRLTERINSQEEALTNIEKSHLSLVSDLEKARVQHNLITREITPKQEMEKDSRGQINPSSRPQNTSSGYKKIHIVAEGENLNNISMKYYKTPHRWSEIYEANADVITDVNRVRVGTALVIPE